MAIISAPSSAQYFCCGACPQTFSQGWEARDKHCDATGHDKPQFECARCPEWFASQAEVDTHMESANHWPYLCQFCDLSWPIEDQCVEHETEAHQEEDQEAPSAILKEVPPQPVTQTPLTASEATKPQGLHLREDHGLIYKCRECHAQFEFRGMRGLRGHYLKAPDHGADCPYCKKRFGSASKLCGHLEYGMCPKARHLDHFGLYRHIRLKDPYQKLTIQLPDWDGKVLAGNARPFFYHCPTFGCKKKFRTLVVTAWVEKC
ncbi:hypothetical protein QBC37DRAFT_398450 [Rhypophila decipiens]|uniref:C2H2-type domain-containing protein n=1 Tax=Rhypophila decipiens TaxID=261697 RepID=A0AAN7B9Q4_9PEZI|nr:hypothetical protein QBC37DRAFT_398450 [Rhypophila decipiens]